jgi:hypothetical protein
MDIITMNAVGMITPIDSLIPHIPYMILHMEPIGDMESSHLLVKLWDEWYLGAGQFIFVILPENYVSQFGPALVAAINSCTVFYKLILTRFSSQGQPLLLFEHYHRTVQ